MGKFFTTLFALALGMFALYGCSSRVGNGEVGVRYHTLGGDRGVEQTPLGMGWYFTGWGTNIETFPTFAQTRNWSGDEQLKFADKDGLQVTADVGITYLIDGAKAPYLYQRYRRGADEIMDIFIHNMVRDGLIERAANMPIEEIYGPGRAKLLQSVQTDVERQVGPQGIAVQKIYWIGNIDVPDNVKASINNKIVAIQKAQQVENEVAQTKAEAQKEVAKAQGDAQAILTRAQSQAQANKVLAESLTPSLVEYMKVQKWNGQLPRVASGNAGILMNMGDAAK